MNDEIELAMLRKQVSDAAREIPCAGPIAHRIRILKQEHEQALTAAFQRGAEAMRKACIEKADSMKAWYWKKWQVNLPDERALYWDGKATAASEIADALSRVEVKSDELKDSSQPTHSATAVLLEIESRVASLRAALEQLLECSACQNGCAPDDMTCASNVARKALGEVK